MQFNIPYYQQLIEKNLQSIPLPTYPAELYDPIRYTLALGGKRLRPVVALMACELVGGKTEDALDAALSLELLHNFTLIHDDIMDQAPLRRGQETVYRKWNSNIAILSGDTMFALAYDYLGNTPSQLLPRILKLYNRLVMQICEGQQMDMNFETAAQVGISDYLEMIRLKTAVLFAGSMQIGAMLGGASDEDSRLLYLYGENLGIAFQLQDDLLDAFGDKATFGKEPGGDIVANKKTFLFLKSLEIADDATKHRLNQLYCQQPVDPRTKIEEVIDIFNRLKIRHYTEELMYNYYHTALGFLEQVPALEQKKAEFRTFGKRLLDRQA